MAVEMSHRALRKTTKHSNSVTESGPGKELQTESSVGEDSDEVYAGYKDVLDWTAELELLDDDKILTKPSSI